MKKAISTSAAPTAVGPYSQAVVANGFIFTSGQIPLDREGNLIEGDIQAQARQCLENLKAILEAARAGMEDLVKVTVYIPHFAPPWVLRQIFCGAIPVAENSHAVGNPSLRSSNRFTLDDYQCYAPINHEFTSTSCSLQKP